MEIDADSAAAGIDCHAYSTPILDGLSQDLYHVFARIGGGGGGWEDTPMDGAIPGNHIRKWQTMERNGRLWKPVDRG